ncbi:MAG: Rieske (2Fe-2S) protein [Pigmentiphaga sp.]|uniref:Rieske (2Fe-2S) protein n=1 Tax=Pigmentiphaga sp. TaxID=1977564 RepID=UPI0029B513D2|nr:Rieske (2Fe-2S) protein [Pigmentiphaga sp.]MDX3906233.1 Rieske (2Fe-2S) protein [Pigmentiphaga sp.]
MNHALHSHALPWCAVAASRDVPALMVMPVMLADLPLAIWRSDDGHIHAWYDRCPHRGMRLSLGAVAPRGLVCPYHGWRFGNDAQCNFIPAHPASVPPASAKAQSYPVVERHGFIWVAKQDTPAEPPPLPHELEPIRSMHMPVDGMRLAEAWLRSCLHTAGRLSVAEYEPVQAGGSVRRHGWRLPEGSFEATAESNGAVLHGRWREGGSGVDYVGLVQPVSRGTSMLHLAGVGPLSADAKRGLNQALVVLRHGLAEQRGHRIDWRTAHECA